MIAPFLCCEVDTFSSLGERRELVQGWAERLRSELERLVGARDGELDLVWTSGRDRSIDLSGRSWKRALSDLGDEALAYLGLQLGRGGGFEIETTPIGPPDAARSVTFRVPPDAGSIAELQALVVALAKELALAVDAATGYITLDRVTAPASPYERAVGADASETRRRARERVRGYFWGMFLSDTHIRLLGGGARVRAEAPVASVEEVGRLTYLQLTERVDDTPEATLRALRDFLEPLLPAGRGSAPFDPFPPVRVLPDDLERPVSADAAPAATAPSRPGPALVFKHEDEDERGRPIGPAIFNDDHRIEDLGWMTLEDARALAASRGWHFGEG
jgi:hypothetical protein